MANRLWTPDGTRPEIIVASLQEAETLKRVMATAVVDLLLQSTDINIEGMYLDTSWLGASQVRTSRDHLIPIEDAINSAYPENAQAIIQIMGDVRARDVMRFLRAVHRNNQLGTANRTRLALLKEW